MIAGSPHRGRHIGRIGRSRLPTLLTTLTLLAAGAGQPTMAADTAAAVVTIAPPGMRYEAAVQAAANGDLAPARLLAAAMSGDGEREGLTPGAALLLRGSLADLLGD